MNLRRVWSQFERLLEGIDRTVKILFVRVGDSQQVVRFHARCVDCKLFVKYLPRFLEAALLYQCLSILKGGCGGARLCVVSSGLELWRCKCRGENRNHDQSKAAEKSCAAIDFLHLNRSAITRLHMPSEG